MRTAADDVLSSDVEDWCRLLLVLPDTSAGGCGSTLDCRLEAGRRLMLMTVIGNHHSNAVPLTLLAGR